jgi:hypothetical protein
VAASDISTCSSTPPTDSTKSQKTSERRLDELTNITQGIERLENKRLQAQRFAPSEEKSDHLAKLALGAKVERALRWRMTGQDAVWRPKRASAQLPVKASKKMRTEEISEKA